MTKNLKKEKQEELNTETTPVVEKLPHKAIGIFLNEKTNSWEVAMISFDGNTGRAFVESTHGNKDDDRSIAIERFKIMAIREGVI
jgi:hypothetical protein